MTDKFDKALDEVLLKYFTDGYKQGFKDGYEAGELAEREDCAKVCESMSLEWKDQKEIAQVEYATMKDCAAAIRARGQRTPEGGEA